MGKKNCKKFGNSGILRGNGIDDITNFIFSYL